MVRDIEYSAVIEEASFATAKLVVTTLRIEDINNLIVFHCKRLGVPVAVHGFDSSVIPELQRLDVDYIIDTKSSWLSSLYNVLNKRGIHLG